MWRRCQAAPVAGDPCRRGPVPGTNCFRLLGCSCVGGRTSVPPSQKGRASDGRQLVLARPRGSCSLRTSVKVRDKTKGVFVKFGMFARRRTPKNEFVGWWRTPSKGQPHVSQAELQPVWKRDLKANCLQAGVKRLCNTAAWSGRSPTPCGTTRSRAESVFMFFCFVLGPGYVPTDASDSGADEAPREGLVPQAGRDWMLDPHRQRSLVQVPARLFPVHEPRV